MQAEFGSQNLCFPLFQRIVVRLHVGKCIEKTLETISFNHLKKRERFSGENITFQCFLLTELMKISQFLAC